MVDAAMIVEGEEWDSMISSAEEGDEEGVGDDMMRRRFGGC